MMQRKKPDLNKILRSILLILGIVLMLLKISARASAEEMLDYVQDYLYEDMDLHFANWRNYQSSISTIVSQCPYFVRYNVTINGSNYSIYDFFVKEYLGINCLYLNNHYYSAGVGGLPSGGGYLCTKNSSLSFDSTGTCAYKIIVYNNNSLVRIFRYSNTSQYSESSGWFSNARFFRSDLYTFVNVSSDPSSGSYYVNTTNYSAYGNLIINSSKNVFTDVHTTVPDPVDSRFSAWTSLDQSGKKLLNVSWDSQAYPNTGSYTYQSSTIALQVAVNGQSSTVSFSSTDYPELFVSGNSSYIPYKFIQKLANIATVQPSDTFYLEKITLTQQAYPSAAGSSASQSYTASTVYSLNLGEDVVEIPNIQQVQTVSVNYTQIVSGADFAVSSGTSVTPPDWANILSIAICDYTSAGGSTTINDPSLYDYIFMKDNGAMALYSSSSSDFNINIFVNGLTASSTEVSVPFQQGLSLFYKDFLPELFNSYDVVLISMNSINGSSATVTDSYYYTASYYSKLSIRSLGNLQLGVEAAAYYSKALYDYCYIRFNGIAESLESMRISNNNLLSSINANILNLQDFVSSGTDRIVNAISSISSGGGGMSVSDLSGALNTLFMPSFEWDQVNYQDYLDSMGVLALPFEFVFDTQSIIKNNYSASLVMPVNDFSVPLGKDFSDNNIEFTVFEDQEDFTFVPTSIFPASIWSVFQYLAAFGLVIGEAWFTYVHIFRKEEKSGDF